MIAALTAAMLAQATPAAAPPDPYAEAKAIIADAHKIVTPNGIDDRFEVTLGGARQVVSVRGSDRSNPILLFIHGGPGAPELPVAWTFQRPWEDYFTVVQWDQRGAGASFRLNGAAALKSTMTPERHVDDAIALIEALRTRYAKRRIVVLGHSWGSYVGLSVAIRRPDLLYGYVGIGQIIDVRASEKILFDWTLARARADRNAAAIRELEALQPYPGAGPLRIERTDTQRKWGVHYGALAAYRDNADFYFRAPRLSPAYTPADRAAIDPGGAFSTQTLWPAFSAISFEPVTRMRVPVVMLLGRHDYTTPAAPVAAWMKRLGAPSKTVVWLEHSAHLGFVEEPGRVFAALLRDVLPLTQGGPLRPPR